MIISGGRDALPESFPAGSESRQLVGLHDVYATVCDLLEIEIPAGQALDSVSFVRVLRNQQLESAALREHLLVQGCVPMEYEQAGVLRIAEESGLEPERDERGLVVGLKRTDTVKGERRPDRRDIRARLSGGRKARNRSIRSLLYDKRMGSSLIQELDRVLDEA